MEWNEFQVDVAGVQVIVKGEEARDHLERVNRQFLQMRGALEWISDMFPSPEPGEIARQTLKDLT